MFGHALGARDSDNELRPDRAIRSYRCARAELRFRLDREIKSDL